MSLSAETIAHYRNQLSCNFKQLDDAFAGCMQHAQAVLSEQGIQDYLDGASLVCKIGRGFDPVLTYLEEMPDIAAQLGEGTLKQISAAVWQISRTPNGRAIPLFLQTLPEVARRLGSAELLGNYLSILFELMERTTGSIHGFHTTIPSPALPKLLEQMPYLINQLALGGLKNWIEYGIRNYGKHPPRQEEYFSLQSAEQQSDVAAGASRHAVYPSRAQTQSLFASLLGKYRAFSAVFGGFSRCARTAAVF